MASRSMWRIVLLLIFVTIAAVSDIAAQHFDVIIRGGTIYDGTGRNPIRADIGIRGDRIAAIGDLARKQAAKIIDATGMAVSPGFINMLSWSTESLIVDPRSLGELKQGVTTQIFGEGESMGPLNDRMKKEFQADQGDLKYDITWTSLADYLNYLEKRGVSQNVASFIGATTVRRYVIGDEDKAPTPAQLD
ncbi:MAG: D-aminoacylase, partial [Acidobacteria bacterium]|nr:D-aminoacylase [Acidobacteriota bacterium]